MEKYPNRAGNSGITGYKIGIDFIRVQFSDGAVYLYDYSSSGSTHVEQMKQLARQGQGLNSYINRFVRDKYARKER